MLAIRTILHPTGLSKVDRGAFRLAALLARTHAARLVVLHVMKPWYLYGRARVLGAYLRQKREIWEALHQVRAADLNFPLRHRLAEGEPVSAILHVAKEMPCDLIVMGTHRRSGLRRLLKRSTAEAVIRKAPCPVLTVGATTAGWLSRPDLWPATGLGTEVESSEDLVPSLARQVKRTAKPGRTSGAGPGSSQTRAGFLCSV